MAAAALPRWVMLELFVFRRDDPKSFRGDKRTSATGTTCAGTRFEVSFVLAEPPTPSRIYLSWPEGPKHEQMCHLVATHRDPVLLRLDSLVDKSHEPQRFGDFRHEYFIYIADPTSQVPPLLRPLPECLKEDPDLGIPWTHPFPLWTVGLLRHGKDEFAVASLKVFRPLETSEFQAELWVLHSLLPCDDVAVSWEKMILPIQYRQEDHFDDLYNWVTNEVVPFKNSLCWVNYSRGILFCDDIFGDGPKVSYFPFLWDSFLWDSSSGFPLLLDSSAPDDPESMCKELYRRLCVTDGGSQLVSVDVTRHDRKGFGLMAPGTGFTLTIRTLDIAENRTMRWKPMADAVITSDQLWAANTEHLPHDLMILPLLSMDVPNIVYLVLFDSEEGRFSLVAIDSSDKQVLGSVVTYIKSWKEGLSTDDADMVRAKPSCITQFLPSEFPKFLNLNSSRSRTRTFSDDEDHDYTTADEIGLSQLPNAPPATQAIQQSQPSRRQRAVERYTPGSGAMRASKRGRHGG